MLLKMNSQWGMGLAGEGDQSVPRAKAAVRQRLAVAGVAYSGVNLKYVYSEGARTIASSSCAFVHCA